MRPGFVALLLVFGLAKPHLVQAAPLKPKPPGALPDIEEMLTEAGWTVTPEMSAKFSTPGDILDDTNTTIVDGADCFEAKPKEGAFAKMEVTQSMAAGVRMRVNIVGVGGGVGACEGGHT